MKNRQRHPLQLGRAEVEAFLSDLATRGRVNASTQNQALGALLLLCCKVLVQRLPGLDDVVRTKRSARLPTLLSMSEFRAPLNHREGQPQLVATPFYGTGLSLLEALQLRVRDVDLHSRILTIRAGKGDRGRRAILPESCRALVSTAIELSLAQHPADLERGAGWVELPHALDRKHSGAGRTIPLQWVFPTTRIHRRRETGQLRRHHLHESFIQHTLRETFLRSGIRTRTSCDTLLHSLATHLLEDGHDTQTTQELLGHRAVSITRISTHVLNRGPFGVRSPADRLDLP